MKGKWLAIGIILLFVGVTIAPTIAQDTEKSQSASRGSWLYVGGSGPGNYTRIQDAIDNASDDDTVYVYNDSSPYKGRLTISKSIKLIGEEKESTVIDTKSLSIAADYCQVSNFSIIQGDQGLMWVFSNYCKIENNNLILYEDYLYNDYVSVVNLLGDDNKILDNFITEESGSYSHIYGIYIGYQASDNNEIMGNEIWKCSYGIYLTGDAKSTLIKNNYIHNNWWGIFDLKGINTEIISNRLMNHSFEAITIYYEHSGQVINNTIESNREGINLIGYCDHISLIGNQIKNNQQRGLYILDSYYNTIRDNNFYDSAVFIYENNIAPSHNIWKHNYWKNSLGILPKIIIGGKYFYFFNIWIPWIEIDWSPRTLPFKPT